MSPLQRGLGPSPISARRMTVYATVAELQRRVFFSVRVRRQLLAGDKKMSSLFFPPLLEMAPRDCPLQLSVVLMSYDKNNFTSLTASLARLRSIHPEN